MSDRETDVRGALLGMLANALFGRDLPDAPADPAALWREAYRQGVFMLALKNAQVDSYPPSLRQEIRSAVNTFLARNLRVSQGHIGIGRLLENAGIPHVLIKGLVSAADYPEPELRQLGDVDFFVDPADVPRTEALLEAEGFAPLKKSHGTHHVYKKDGCRYELHFAIPGIPDGEKGARCRAYFRDMLERAAVRETPFGPMRTPAPFHHGLILLLHMAHHMTYGGIGLRQLCDWAVFEASLTDADLRAAFTDALQKTGLLRFADCLTDLCVRRLGCPAGRLPAEADPAVADALLEDFFESGNFGQKDVARSRQAYLITSGTKNRSRLGRLLSVMLDMSYQKWPVTKKIKLLVPVSWAYFTILYLWRAARGRRPKLYARAALDGARTRTALYDKLRLFEDAKEDL